MTLGAKATTWAALESRSHDPEVQAEIAEAIAAGIIRVMPVSEGRIRIIPLKGGEQYGPLPVANTETPHKRDLRRRLTRIDD